MPDGVPVLVPAARFLADCARAVERARRRPACSGRTTGASPSSRRISTGSRWSRWCSRPSATAAPTARRALLRERYGFRGELRATGDVLRDQFLFLLRAGFDAFEVKKDADAAAFVEALARYSVFYQPAGDGRTAVQRARRDHAHRAIPVPDRRSKTLSGLGTLGACDR